MILVFALISPALAQHTDTHWQLKASMKYDALCLMNVLSGDAYYLDQYQAEYDHFHPLFKPEEQAAFVDLKRIIKDEHHSIVSAQLSLYFSVLGDQTLEEMIRTAHDPSLLKAELHKTTYWDEDGWAAFDKARPSLEIALRALVRIGFADYWTANVKPKIDARIAELSPDLPKYNVIPAIEKHLGFALPSNTITIYLLEYSKPHGIRITGMNFITHRSYPFKIVLHNAVHECMHPPYKIADPAVRKAVDLLGQDALVKDKVEHHDRSFGYNSAEGYIEEDSVQALEEIICEEFGVGYPVQKYWSMQDGGMHVLATAIYTLYKQAWAAKPEPYSQWFVRAVNDGTLRGKNLQRTVDAFAASKTN